LGERVAVDRESLACRDAARVRHLQDERSEPAHLFFEKAVRV
jgi:hypothetical protein